MKTRFAIRLASRPFARSVERLQQWVSEHLIQNVPEELSYCEYECQDPDCRIAKQAFCEKRTLRADPAMVRID